MQKGHDVYYFLARNKTKCVYDVSGTVINTEIVLNNKNILSLIKSAFIMRKYKKRYKIDVSISFMEEFNYINILSKQRDLVITRICTILSQRKDLQQSFLYKADLVRFMYNRADKVVVMTDYAKQEMSHTYGIDKRCLVKIPNPITTLQYPSNDLKWIYGDEAIVCVGRLENVKQHNIAIRAFASIAEKIPTAKLLILGIGPTEGKLKSLVKKLNLEDRVFFLGFRKDIGYYLHRSRVFLMTSKTEGFPNSMLEAMSMGLPVVSIQSPGAPIEILKAEQNNKSVSYGKYGIMTPYINHDFLSQKPIMKEEVLIGDALTVLLQDRELWKKYSNASYSRAKMYDTEKVMSRWNRLICGEKRRK